MSIIYNFQVRMSSGLVTELTKILIRFRWDLVENFLIDKIQLYTCKDHNDAKWWQPNRSDKKLEHNIFTACNPAPGKLITSVQNVYGNSMLLRSCTTVDGSLAHGKYNDCDGCEIHCEQKFRWRALIT